MCGLLDHEIADDGQPSAQRTVEGKQVEFSPFNDVYHELAGQTAYYAKPRHKETISYRDAFIIGLAQAVATLPGLSRSGTTIATGLILGNRKESVAQFSFLMVLAPILGKMVLDLMSGELAAQSIGTAPLLAGFAAAFVVGCLACKFMINIVKRGKLNWFAIYCTLVGGLAIIRYFVIQ